GHVLPPALVLDHGQPGAEVLVGLDGEDLPEAAGADDLPHPLVERRVPSTNPTAVRPAGRACSARHSVRSPSTVVATGFSTRSGSPRSIAATALGTCWSLGVATTTAS